MRVLINICICSLQFQAALLQRWDLPPLLCAVAPFCQTVSVNASVFTLMAIAVERYRAICFPFNSLPSKCRNGVRIL